MTLVTLLKKNTFPVFIFLIFLSITFNSFGQYKLGRWKVKTICDADTIKINFDSIVPSSVHEQLKIPIERHLTNRRSPTETIVYSIPCRLVAFRKTRDGDIHLIIQDTNTYETMVAEIPDPEGVSVKKSFRFATLKEVRASFETQFGKPGKYFRYLDPPENYYYRDRLL